MSAPLIELRAVRKRYGGSGGVPEVEVLHGIDLQIHAGEFMAIVGASGSGKSTLMNILGCLDRPSDGAYLFNGRDVADFNADELAWLRREAFGFVFQGYHLIPSESARENVEMPAIYAGKNRRERQQRAAQLLSRLGLAEKQHNRPGQMSGGQQQRVSIARALMNGGRIILADEPTGALDSTSGTEVMKLLRELSEAGHTIILITHDRQVAAQADRVVEVLDGEVVADSRTSAPTTRQVDPVALSMVEAAADKQAGAFRADIGEALRAAWRGMCANSSRTALTLLGIVIGVASVIVMLGVGEGAKQSVMDQVGTMGATTMFINGRSPEDGGPRGVLSMDDLQAVEALPDVARVMPVARDESMVRFGNVAQQVDTIAATDDWPAINQWPVAQGRFFSRAEDYDMAAVVVIGQTVKRRFFGDLDHPLGQRLLIGNTPFMVIGVMAEKGSAVGGGDQDAAVFVPFRSGIFRVFSNGRSFDPHYVQVQVRSSERVLAAQAEIESLLLGRHGRKDFYVANAAASLQAELRTKDSMTLMLSLIAAVSLLVGGIGVMNVMLMTVQERTKEIGIRVATGARQRDILRQFLCEASLVTMTGGLIGLAIGMAVGAGLVMTGVPLVFSVRALLGAFACSVATGLLFGYMPARTAARLDPVVALA
ncbi:ABC transporter permease [Pseudomonas sp. LRF_L74]|uniref:ABC transporter permease n=1 Tax=Pseudomonas sp. LRF_L74 TaxID=3369422 RepID=UPI003F5FC1D1